jgi:hypothetical protein
VVVAAAALFVVTLALEAAWRGARQRYAASRPGA